MSDENAETIEPQPEPSPGNIPREIGHYKVRRVIGSGEYVEASNWYAKSIAFADEENEDIEMYRAKLREATAQVKGPAVE